MFLRRESSRPGTIIVLTALTLIIILTFIALAFDLGLLMLARNQSQMAADSAAMAGARTLTGDTWTNNNYANATPNAKVAAAANSILGKAIDADSQLTVTIGDYYYDSSSRSFKINPNGKEEGNNWTLAQATINSQRPSYFANLLGVPTLNTTAMATAVHRPRDTAIVVDFSGSMRFESMLGGPHGNSRTASMNPDTVYPTFGHYSGNSSKLIYSSDMTVGSGEQIGKANVAVATAAAPGSVISGFYGDTTPFGTTTKAFTAASAAYADAPGGDVPLKASKGSGGYAKHVSDFLAGNSSTTNRDWRWELDGYASYSDGGINTTTSAATDYASVPFNGYTQGPGYWGKTFFTWPPDPRVPLTTTYYSNTQIENIVYRFLRDFGYTAADDSNTSGLRSGWTSFASETALGSYLTTNVNRPGTSVKLTTSDAIYQQILRLYNRNGGPGMPRNGSNAIVPTDWRARFFKTPAGAPLTDTSKLYTSGGSWRTPSNTTYLINYDAILDWIKNSGTNPFPNQLRAGGVVYYTSIPSTIDVNTFPPTDPNQRFWKEYIDEVLGVEQTSGTGASPVYDDLTSYSGFGDDYAWGTASSSSSTTWGQSASYSATSPTSIGYTDNPQRGRLRMWFGALSLVDFIGNYNMGRLWWPGTVMETPTYQTKLAIQAAVKDTIRNHPNDLVSLIYFSSPKPSAANSGFYNYSRAPLGRDQRAMINSLWFSPKVNTNNAEISVYNSSGVNNGDIYDVPRANGGTCYNMPLMLAYNQFSSNANLVNYTANALPGTAGGLGRGGASKLLVFESDGMVNTGASATLTSSANGTGYYRVRVADANNFAAGGTEFPTGVSGGAGFATYSAQSQALAQQICNDLSAGGFSTTRKPVLIHCIAFGSLFEPSNSSSNKTNALANLASLEVIGKVQSSGATTLASSKIIVGDFNTRINNMQTALSGIMQDGVQVTLVSSGAGKP